MKTKAPSEFFTVREKQVIGLLKQGKSNKEISLALGITLSTVEAHLSSIYLKLGVNSRTNAVIKLHERSPGVSTYEQEETGQGNPQLKSDADTLTLKSRDVQYRFLYRRPKTKTIRRVIIFFLLACLIITVVVAIFAALRGFPQVSLLR